MALFSKTIPDTSFYNDVIDYSCMFDYPSSTYLRDPGDNSLASDRTKGAFSAWVKRSTLTAGADGTGCVIALQYNNASYYDLIWFNSSDKLEYRSVQAGALYCQKITTAVYRDCSSWYHIFLRLDTTDATAEDRVQIWVNGVRITSWSTDTPPAQDHLLIWSDYYDQFIGTFEPGTGREFTGNMAEVHWIAETTAEVTDFGIFHEGIWIPKTANPTNGYGDHGFYLDFANANNLGKDVSGNNKDLTATNMGTDHQVIDTPENNFCTLDYNTRYEHSNSKVEEGGRQFHYSGGAAWITCLTNFMLKSGKWYWELNVGATVNYYMVGILAAGEYSGDIKTGAFYIGQALQGFAAMTNSGGTTYVKYSNGSPVSLGLGGNSANDVLQVAFDADNNKIWFGKNGTWSGDPAAGTGAAYDSSDGIDSDLYEYVVAQSTHTSQTGVADFGQGGFAHTPPTGFKSLCTQNLPRPIIINSKKAIDVITYEGTGTENIITGLEFQPDFVWIKNRDATDSHCIYDSARGSTFTIHVDETAESEDAQNLKSFNVNGFTLGTADEVNTNAENFVAWCLKEHPDYGFDIVSYEGTGAAHTENHNLGAIPKFMIVKNLTDVDGWTVYHYAAFNKTDPETDYARIDTDGSFSDANTLWNDTAPTSTQFTVGTHNRVNGSGDSIIAYLFADVPGVIKCFAYEGNGNAAGPYVYCGFRPKWIIWKDADATSNWGIIDYKRDTYNPSSTYLLTNLTNSEATLALMDVNANGFKIRYNGAGTNTNNYTHVGIAFAEQPFKYANAR